MARWNPRENANLSRGDFRQSGRKAETNQSLPNMQKSPEQEEATTNMNTETPRTDEALEKLRAARSNSRRQVNGADLESLAHESRQLERELAAAHAKVDEMRAALEDCLAQTEHDSLCECMVCMKAKRALSSTHSQKAPDGELGRLRAYENLFNDERTLHEGAVAECDRLRDVSDTALARVAELEGALQAAGRIRANNYIHWSNAGGDDECSHGFAKGIPCPACDGITLERALTGTNEKTSCTQSAQTLPIPTPGNPSTPAL